MRTQDEVNEAIKIMDQHPDLKAIITPGVDTRTVLSRNQIRSLNQESFRALCALPLDIIIPPGPAEKMFLMQAVTYGVELRQVVKDGVKLWSMVRRRNKL